MKCAIIEGYIGAMPVFPEKKPGDVPPGGGAADATAEEVIDLVEVTHEEVTHEEVTHEEEPHEEVGDFARNMTRWFAEHPHVTVWKMIHHFTDDGDGEDLIVAIIYYIERTPESART